MAIVIDTNYLDRFVEGQEDIKAIHEREFPFGVYCQLCRAFDRILVEAKSYLTAKKKLIDKHAERKNGEIVYLDEEKKQIAIRDMDAYIAEFQELLNLKIELAGIEPIEVGTGEKMPPLKLKEARHIVPLLKAN